MSIKIIGGVNGTDNSASNPLYVSLPNDNLAFPQQVMFSHLDTTIDSFERLRVSEPQVVFEYGFVNGINAAYWDSAAYGAGTILPTAVALGAAAPTLNNDWTQNLNTTTASGTGYWCQSLSHVRYVPGVSTLGKFTFNATVAQANQTVRVGFFTDQGTFPSNAGDGVFFELVGTSPQFTMRSLVAGGVGAATSALQSAWNLDKMDGTGASGVNLDWTKTQHLVIEWQWLGVGTIRFGWETGPKGIIWAHEVHSVNSLAVPWSRSGSLPARAEIYTTGATAQAGLLKLINCVIIQEGDNTGRRGWKYHSADSGTAIRTILATAALGAYYPLMSIRSAVTNDNTKRAQIIPLKATIQLATLGTGPTGYKWALIYAPSALPATATFAVWGSENAQIDIAATPGAALTGGIVLAAGLLNFAVNAVTNIDFAPLSDSLLRIAQNAAGGLTLAGANVLTLAVTPMGAAATAAPTLFATLDWKDVA